MPTQPAAPVAREAADPRQTILRIAVGCEPGSDVCDKACRYLDEDGAKCWQLAWGDGCGILLLQRAGPDGWESLRSQDCIDAELLADAGQTPRPLAGMEQVREALAWQADALEDLRKGRAGRALAVTLPRAETLLAEFLAAHEKKETGGE